MIAYSSYNNIQVHLKEECNTVSMTNKANLCYKINLLSLKDSRDTNQWLIDKVFNIDKEKIFSCTWTVWWSNQINRRYNIKLNP